MIGCYGTEIPLSPILSRTLQDLLPDHFLDMELLFFVVLDTIEYNYDPSPRDDLLLKYYYPVIFFQIMCVRW